jgi:predicted PhzF superfamily epimerase YddE/YHI9
MAQYLQFVTLDVFTTEPFLGNPLAIVFLPENPNDNTITQTQKQIIAREFNLSETIFIQPYLNNGSLSTRTIDIFTTTQELAFAGHPTIGAASWFLHHSQDIRDQTLVKSIMTKAGEIPISLWPNGIASATIAARIPHNVRIHKCRFPLFELLRLHPSLIPFLDASGSASKDFPIVSIVKGMTHILVQLANLAALAVVTTATGGEVIPSQSISNGGYLDEGWESNGVTVIYFYVKDVDDETTGKKVIRSRMILGSLEDPATGSAASGLAVHLTLTDPDSAAGMPNQYNIVQGVEMGRRSDIGLEVILGSDREHIDSVELRGCAVKICEGNILVK